MDSKTFNYFYANCPCKNVDCDLRLGPIHLDSAMDLRGAQKLGLIQQQAHEEFWLSCPHYKEGNFTENEILVLNPLHVQDDGSVFEGDMP